MVKFSKTEQIILSLLADGKIHGHNDFCIALDDAYLEIETVRVHVSNIRKKLPSCEDILFRKSGYIHVRFVARSEVG